MEVLFFGGLWAVLGAVDPEIRVLAVWSAFGPRLVRAQVCPGRRYVVPERRHLAVVGAGLTGEGVGPWTQVMAVFIDVASGKAAVVEGARRIGRDYPHVAWTEDSEWLLFSNGPDPIVYQPGADTAYIVNVQYHGTSARQPSSRAWRWNGPIVTES